MTARPPESGLIGISGGPDPQHRLELAGHRVAFADDRFAVALTNCGASSLDAGRQEPDAAGTLYISDDLVVAGRMVLDEPGLLRLSATNHPRKTGSASPAAAVAEAWRHGGGAAVMGLQGMFAVAIYDRMSGRTTLVRDPLGERTIYYASGDASTDGVGDRDEVWFCDRLDLLRRSSPMSGQIDLAALRDYLIFAYVPGEQTMFAGAREARPGHGLEVETGASTTWWEPVEQTTDLTLEENAQHLRALLERAVASRRPEGPVGVYLSGGVDSSAITALLCRQNPEDVHTFAVHFGSDLPNELPFVRQVVERTRPGTHHEIELTSDELANALPDTVAALDDPIGDPLTVPNLALGRRAGQVVPTIFNGEGGDPVFGGPKNQPMLLASMYSQGGPRSREMDTVYLRSYQKCFDDLDRLLRPDARQVLASAPDPTAHVSPFLSEGAMVHFVNRLFAANTRLKGSDHILTKVANLTAAAGIVGRSPLFDRELVDAAFAMAPGHKLNGTIEKAVLKHAVADVLPASIIERPKAGMRVPVQTWFRGPLRRRGSKQLLSRKAAIAPYLDRATIKEWAAYDGDPKGRYGRKLWLLLTLEQWMQAHDAH